MATYNHLPVYKVSYDLLVELFRFTKDFTREYKYTIGESIKKELERKNIEVKAGGWKSIAEEAPGVYKDVNEVIEVSHNVGIANKVVRLKPLMVMKG